MVISRKKKVFIYILVFFVSVSLSHKSLYDEESYCCREMSRDIEDVLEAMNIPVVLIRGQIGNEGHIWVSVFGIEIDSVLLIIFPVSWIYSEKVMYFDDYEDYLEYRKL